MFKAILVAALIPTLSVLAQVEAIEPAPGNVYNEGSACNIQWEIDPTGKWTTMNIELMTGANNAMVHLTTVATVDGTKDTSFSYTCPGVTPNAPIYFYQFSSPGAPGNLTWTGRFAIADSSGNTVEPTEETDGIKWGTGSLKDSSSASPAPDYLTNAAVPSSAGTNSSSSATLASASAAGSTVVESSGTTSVTGALTAAGSLTTTRVSTTNSASSAADSASSTASSQSSSSGASALVLDFKARGLQALVGLVGTALIFTTVF